MRKVLLTTTVLVIAVALIGSVGCRILNVDQPTLVGDGVQFQVTVEAEIDNTVALGPGYGLLAIMLPDAWNVDNGTYDAPPPYGGGTMVNYPDGVAMATDYYDTNGHPVPAGYKWVVLRTSSTGNLDGGGGAIPVDFYINITPHAKRTGDDYWISYAVGGVESGSDPAYNWGLEEEQSWENPICLGTAGVNPTSLGELKVRFQ